MKSSYTDGLAYITFECRYHIVFVSRFRRKEMYVTLIREIGMILRELCKRKDVELSKAEECPDHIHIYVNIPPKSSVSSFMGYLKGKSPLIILRDMQT